VGRLVLIRLSRLGERSTRIDSLTTPSPFVAWTSETALAL
jgi:hypothetical protein